MNILYLADPNSIHDLKWIRFFSKDQQCYILVRKHHYRVWTKEQQSLLEKNDHIKFVGEIDDFSIKGFFRNYKTAAFIKQVIQNYNIDLFHIMYAEPNALWAYFRKKFAVPIVLTTRGTDVLKTIPEFFEQKGLLNKIVAFFYRKAFAKIDETSSTSTRQREAVIQIIGKEKEVHIIRTGVDLDKIDANTSAGALAQLKGKKYIFFPRAMRPLYQHELAIQAIAALSPDLREEYSFVFVNKDSKNKTYLQQIQKEMDRVEASFIWLDNLPQNSLFETYKKSSAVVMTPMSDGTPVTAIECMLCRIPLILPPLNYDKDIFEDAVLQFKDWSAEDLAASMTKVLTTENKQMIELGRERAERFADRQKEMTKLLKIYQKYATPK